MSSRFRLEIYGDGERARTVIEEMNDETKNILAWLLSKEKKRVKEDKESYSTVVDLTELGLGFVFLKVYYRRSLKRRVQYFLNRPRGLRTWNLQRKLYSAGLKIPIPIAYIDDGEVECLLSSFVPGSQDLRSLIGEPALDTQFRLFKLGVRFVDLIADFHRKGFVHGDCKWGNVLWVKDTEQLLLVDFDGAGKYSQTLGAKDIARFIINSEEAGIGRDTVDAIISQYAALMNEDISVLKSRMQPFIDSIAARHKRKGSNQGSVSS